MPILARSTNRQDCTKLYNSVDSCSWDRGSSVSKSHQVGLVQFVSRNIAICGFATLPTQTGVLICGLPCAIFVYTRTGSQETQLATIARGIN